MKYLYVHFCNTQTYIKLRYVVWSQQTTNLGKEGLCYKNVGDPSKLMCWNLTLIMMKVIEISARIKEAVVSFLVPYTSAQSMVLPMNQRMTVKRHF